jgi:hypothetical protein
MPIGSMNELKGEMRTVANGTCSSGPIAARSAGRVMATTMSACTISANGRRPACIDTGSPDPVTVGEGLAKISTPANLQARLAGLIAQAFSTYGSRCLWNVLPPSEGDDVSLVVCQLKRYGDLGAWDLAVGISRAAEDAYDGLE